MSKPISLAAILALAMFIVAALYVSPRSAGAVTPPAPDGQARQGSPALGPVAAQQPAPSSGGPSEGVRVHGQWTIQILNPDGTIADSREFENALVDGVALSAFLGRANSVGLWGVSLQTSSTAVGAQGPCGFNPSPSVAIACDTAENGASFAQAYLALHEVFPTLVVSAPSSGAGFGTFTLTGTATARAASDVGIVGTYVFLCGPSTAPSSPCGSGSFRSFTQKTLGTPIPVSNGQQIQVTVVISFS